jgi:hypothetical protein
MLLSFARLPDDREGVETIRATRFPKRWDDFRVSRPAFQVWISGSPMK